MQKVVKPTIERRFHRKNRGEFMTLDEAILHAREVAEIQRNNDKLNKTLGKSSPYYNTDCIKCAEEHEQLADWLEELAMLRLDSCMIHMPERLHLVENGYNKALDDFVNACNKQFAIMYGQRYVDMRDIVNIAEQLKAGIIND